MYEIALINVLAHVRMNHYEFEAIFPSEDSFYICKIQAYCSFLGMSDTLKIDLGVFVLFNLLYDVTAFSHDLVAGAFQYR